MNEALKVNFTILEFLPSVDRIHYFTKKIVNDVGLMDAYVDFVLATILL